MADINVVMNFLKEKKAQWGLSKTDVEQLLLLAQSPNVEDQAVLKEVLEAHFLSDADNWDVKQVFAFARFALVIASVAVPGAKGLDLGLKLLDTATVIAEEFNG